MRKGGGGEALGKVDVLAYVIPVGLFLGLWLFLLWRYKRSGRPGERDRFAIWRSTAWIHLVLWVALLIIGLATQQAVVIVTGIVGLIFHLLIRFAVARATKAGQERG